MRKRRQSLSRFCYHRRFPSLPGSRPQLHAHLFELKVSVFGKPKTNMLSFSAFFILTRDFYGMRIEHDGPYVA